MSFYLDDYIRAVRSQLQEVRESVEVDEEDIRDSISLAVRQHSQPRPEEKVADLDGDGEYDLSLPDDWDIDFSTYVSVEYPQGEREPTYIEPKEIRIYKDADGTAVLRLLADTPASGETVRLTYMIPHSVTEDSTTIPDVDFWAVVCLSTSVLATKLAARYMRVWEPTLDLDIVNYGTKAREYLTLAAEKEAKWRELLGIPAEGTPVPAFAYGDWDVAFSWNRPLLVHKAGHR